MPSKIKKACAFPGCPVLFSGAGSYCPTHAKTEQRRYNLTERTPEAKKRYDRRWRKIRARVLNANPFCVECRKNGRFTEATEVHHILPLSRGGTNDIENLMPLCKSCHSKISVRDGDRFPRKTL
ncbi:MAG: HNH endonuclease [Selenomonadaceae bacterium]|nr:HNH endonuclease [Selenomonadaceae bacterium]